MTTTSIFQTVLDNIDAEKKAWCQGDWNITDDKTGAPVSRCLVEHIDLATKVSYLKPNGKVFISKDPKKWAKRNAVVRTLLGHLTPKQLDGDCTAERLAEVQGEAAQDDASLREHLAILLRMPDERRLSNHATNLLITFNDREATKKSTVRALLKKAIKKESAA